MHLHRDSFLHLVHNRDGGMSREMSRHKERDRHMKISVQDVSHVNWDAVRNQLAQEVGNATANISDEAQRVLATLKPGERKTLAVKVGSITVSVPKS